MAATVARFPAPMAMPGWFVSVLALIRFEPDTFRRRLVALPGRWRPSPWPSVTGLPSSPVRGEHRGGVAAASAEWTGVVISRRLVSRGVIGPGTGSGTASLHRRDPDHAPATVAEHGDRAGGEPRVALDPAGQRHDLAAVKGGAAGLPPHKPVCVGVDQLAAAHGAVPLGALREDALDEHGHLDACAGIARGVATGRAAGGRRRSARTRARGRGASECFRRSRPRPRRARTARGRVLLPAVRAPTRALRRRAPGRRCRERRACPAATAAPGPRSPVWMRAARARAR